MNFSEKVYDLIKQIPYGRVSSYKILSNKLNTKAYRVVGLVLNKNSKLDEIPCFKIVRNNGEIGGYILGVREKIKRLGKEGIKIKNNKIVDFKKILYRF